jgi:hypothetical protein
MLRVGSSLVEAIDPNRHGGSVNGVGGRRRHGRQPERVSFREKANQPPLPLACAAPITSAFAATVNVLAVMEGLSNATRWLQL